MFRVPLQVRKFASEEKFIFLPAFIRLGTIAGQIQLLVDTGSPFTVLAPRDGIRFRLPLKRYARQNAKTVQLAGYLFKKFPLDKATLTITDEKDDPYHVTTDTVELLTPTKVNKQTMRDTQHIPSIVGLNWLTEQDVTLVYNPNRSIAFLDFP